MALFAVNNSNKASRYQEAEQAGNQQKDNETLWRVSSWEPITVFTWALVVVGGSQAALFVWQLRLIRAGMHDAKGAAIAARDSADAATRQSEIAQNAYIAGIRPWLDFTITLTDGIRWDEHNVGLTYYITVVNHGRSPAVKVTIQEMIQPHHPIVEFNIQQRTRDSSIQIANAQKELFSFFTNTIFPGTPFIRQPITISTPIDGLDTLKAAYESRTSGSDVPAGGNWLHLKFMILLTYETPGGDRRHHTWKSFDIVRLTPPPYGSYAFPMRENISVNLLTLRPDAMSDYAE